MYGTDIYALNINVVTPFGGNRRLWSMFGNQGNQWHQASVTLPKSSSLQVSESCFMGSKYIFNGFIKILNFLKLWTELVIFKNKPGVVQMIFVSFLVRLHIVHPAYSMVNVFI
jgi:hypothetical protein